MTVPKTTAEQISGRLRRWWQQVRGYDSRTAFATAIDVPPSTVIGWFDKGRPTVPEVVYLIRLAKRERVSLDWLLLGEGGERLGADRPRGELADAIREHIVASIAGDPRFQRRAAFVGRVLPDAPALLAEIVERYRVRAEDAARAGDAARWRAAADRPDTPARLVDDLLDSQPADLDLPPREGALMPIGARLTPETEIGPAVALAPEDYSAWREAGAPRDWKRWAERHRSASGSRMSRKRS